MKKSLIKLLSVTLLTLLLTSCNKEEVTPLPLYQTYTGIMQQSSNNDPVITILGNNTLGTINWTRKGIGMYEGTLPMGFKQDSTFIQLGQGNDNNRTMKAEVDYNNRISLRSFNHDGNFQDVFSNISIEIKMY